MGKEWVQFLADSSLCEFYGNSLRAPLFTGFFTLTSFMLAAKAFVVLNIKREVYDTDAYASLLRERRKINSKITRYGPLKRLSSLLFVTIILAFVTSVAQMTFGLISQNWAVLLCLGCAVVAIVMVAISLVSIRINLKEWLEHSDCPEQQS